MNFNSAKEAMEHGFAMITEERKANGLFLKSGSYFQHDDRESESVQDRERAFGLEDGQGDGKRNQSHAHEMYGTGRHDHKSFRRKSAESDLRQVAGA